MNKTKKEDFDTLFDLIKSFKINNIAFCDCCDNFDHCEDCETEMLADYLVEHGVYMDEKMGKMDCFQCGGKNTVDYVISFYNGHKRGQCNKCGAKFIE